MEEKETSYTSPSLPQKEYFNWFYFFLNLFDFYIIKMTHLCADFVSSTVDVSDASFLNHYFVFTRNLVLNALAFLGVAATQLMEETELIW